MLDTVLALEIASVLSTALPLTQPASWHLPAAQQQDTPWVWTEVHQWLHQLGAPALAFTVGPHTIPSLLPGPRPAAHNSSMWLQTRSCLQQGQDWAWTLLAWSVG